MKNTETKEAQELKRFAFNHSFTTYGYVSGDFYKLEKGKTVDAVEGEFQHVNKQLYEVADIPEDAETASVEPAAQTASVEPAAETATVNPAAKTKASKKK